MAEKEAEINEKFRQHNVGLQQTLSSGRDKFQRLHQILDQRVSGNEAGSSSGGGKGSGRGTSLLDLRGCKFPTMPDTCSVEQFKKWRHDGLAFLYANPRWSQSSRVLHEIWKSAAEVDLKIYHQAIDNGGHAVEMEAGSGEFHKELWQLAFEERAEELYQLVSRNLSLSCFSDFKQIDSIN